MRRFRAVAYLAVLAGAGRQTWGEVRPVGGIRVILECPVCPQKSAVAAASDAAGAVRLVAQAPGQYMVQFVRLPGAPVQQVSVIGEIRRLGAGPAAAPMAVSIPVIPFHPATGIHRQPVNLPGPAEILLRFTTGGGAPAGLPGSVSGPSAAAPAQIPLVTYQPRHPFALARGKNYAVVHRRTRQLLRRFYLNLDGTVTAPMVAKEGEGDPGGGCQVCVEGRGCFNFTHLPPDFNDFVIITADDTTVLRPIEIPSGGGGQYADLGCSNARIAKIVWVPAAPAGTAGQKTDH